MYMKTIHPYLNSCFMHQVLTCPRKTSWTSKIQMEYDKTNVMWMVPYWHIIF